MIKLTSSALLILTFTVMSGETDANALYQQGLDALRSGDNVMAATMLARAADSAEKSKDDALATECNAALYWTRKRFTLADANALHKDEAALKRADAVVSKKVEPGEAQQWLDRANDYAATHTDPLLIAIRYFEVGDRFQTTDAGRKAIDLSLKAMQKIAISEKPTPATTAVAVKSTPAQAPARKNTLKATLYSICDDHYEVRLNDSVIIPYCDSSDVITNEIEITPGDILSVKAVDTGFQRGFSAVLKIKDKSIATSPLWSVYQPASEAKWWNVATAKSVRKPSKGSNVDWKAKVETASGADCESIWGSTSTCYLYLQIK